MLTFNQTKAAVLLFIHTWEVRNIDIVPKVQPFQGRPVFNIVGQRIHLGVAQATVLKSDDDEIGSGVTTALSFLSESQSQYFTVASQELRTTNNGR